MITKILVIGLRCNYVFSRKVSTLIIFLNDQFIYENTHQS